MHLELDYVVYQIRRLQQLQNFNDNLPSRCCRSQQQKETREGEQTTKEFSIGARASLTYAHFHVFQVAGNGTV